MFSVCDVLDMYGLENSTFKTVENLLKTDNKFVGRIDYLGFNGAIGETMYFINKKEYINEIKDSYEVGRPISFKLISEKEREINKELERSLF